VQHWTAREGELPKAVASALPTRLYGCDSCLESCPYFKPDPEAHSEHGHLGPALPADFFLNSSAEEIKRNLRGTALDMAWMSIGAFRRNARLAEKRPAMIDRADSV
ncbi:MAG: hypothetical protein LLF89_04690, partial [Spirochaetaceae bacterium]|nr:hypothetical protein [Spirochaetaceae bacterium]